MKGKLEALEKQALAELEQAAQEGIENLRVKYLGKKGELTSILRGLSNIDAAVRPLIGKLSNEIKTRLEEKFNLKQSDLKEKADLASESSLVVDLTLPGTNIAMGSIHPITQVMREICGIFQRLNFAVVEGPEIETDYYNFEALNFPPEHPARDMQDTFFIEDKVLLRTQTSPVQVRVMEKQKPPVKIVVPGKVFRHDADVSHSPMFHQVEGFLIDEGVTFADLKGVLTLFIKEMFGEQQTTRFRPSFFPFTEPSAEMDMSCFACKGAGCRICKNSGWIEILGAGMIDPAVFKYVKYDPEKYSGFAFGMGVERIAMLKYGIDNIGLFYENDLRFLKQF
ncbi:MAG: phenylalanine--tRNA ligase subunit alpha [bacterium]|nr:phenylalanine--tRNA ligase subunit alpha [bacterium]